MIICKIVKCEYAKKRKDDLYQCICNTIGITAEGKCDTKLILTLADNTDLAIKMSKLVHDQCNDVPHDIGLKLLELIKGCE